MKRLHIAISWQRKLQDGHFAGHDSRLFPCLINFLDNWTVSQLVSILLSGTALQIDTGNLFSAFTDSEGGFWSADFNFIGAVLFQDVSELECLSRSNHVLSGYALRHTHCAEAPHENILECCGWL